MPTSATTVLKTRTSVTGPSSFPSPTLGKRRAGRLCRIGQGNQAVVPEAGSRAPSERGPGAERAFRGLALVFVLSFLNLVGVLLTATVVGGIAPWTRWQFIGLFGVVEVASGLANVLSPNIWRLPIAELQTSRRTDVKLAASALLIPHWGGLARTAAGLVCMTLAAWQEGIAPATLLLVPLVVAFAWLVLALSALIARAGVAHPELDVLQFVVRLGRGEKELEPISIGASALQFLLSIATLPIAKLLPPSMLYQPPFGPSASALLLTLAFAAGATGAVYLVWSDRVVVRASREQQREAEAQS
jgi:hypothetical protein